MAPDYLVPWLNASRRLIGGAVLRFQSPTQGRAQARHPRRALNASRAFCITHRASVLIRLGVRQM